MRKTLLVSLLLTVSLLQQVVAQTRSLTGRVLDQATRQGIPGATVLVVGTTNGVSTDAEGGFTLTVSNTSGTLRVSSVGYLPADQVIGTSTSFTFTLAPDTKALEEVVVVGYGSQSKELLTGAVATVSAKEFENQPVAGLDQALQGRASGVQVTSSSGTPGGAVSVRIRGTNSISASATPLYVVDGVPINTGSYSDIGVGNQVTNALADINPNDIASMEILKDASAAAIYGSRAANGVVLITTKHGKSGRTRVTLDVYGGVQETRKKLGVLTGQESQELINEARTNVGLAPRYVAANPTAAQGLFSTANTDWQDEIFRKAAIQSYTLTASGGDAKTTFLVSGTYFDQKGIIIGSAYKRGSGRINLDHRLSDHVKIGANLTVSRSNSNRINNDNNIYGVLSGSLLLGSQTPIRNADGTYARDPFNSTVENPVASALVPTFISNQTRGIGNVYAEVEPVRNLIIRSSVGGDYLNLLERRFIPSTLLAGASTSGQAQINSRYDITWLNENTVTYSHNFEDHHLTALLGQSAQKSSQQGLAETATGFATNKLQQLTAGATKVTTNSDASEWTLLSYFGRLNYDFQNKYILTGTIRTDGSSRFGRNNKYGVFPAVSGSWRISQEAFLVDNPVISELKLRGGWGKTGNFNIGNYSSLTLFGVGTGNLANYNNVAGLAPIQIGDQSLTWEKSSETNIGLDVGVLKNRILLSANVFKRNSDALLLDSPLPLTSGFSTVTTNIGSMWNKGIELDITSQNVQTQDFSWNSNFNISFIRNRITKLPNNNADQAAGFASLLRVGESLGSFYGYEVDRIYQTAAEVAADNEAARAATNGQSSYFQQQNTAAGDIRFKDLSGDNVITAADQKIIGRAQPKFFGGFSNQLSYKGIDLGIFFQYSYGNDIYNNTRAFTEGMNSVFGQSSAVLDRWTPTNTDTDIPRAAFGDPNINRRVSDRWLEDGSYLRLKTATLGYNLPKSLVTAAHVQNIRIYVAGQNLLTFTKYKGLDPEVSTFTTSNTSPGTDFLTFPQARVYQVGLNIGL
ncbi:TonB-dependent receptor [Hymenobacter sp. NBH84]|uniref:SusC/RagA family TonB-linked outer membrane protein n=1 Tax=Hymenobacter sp. NBH84 TaxID=2596915 RepID=UPI001628B1DE|nr:TonB-dependent receptor [Hymenobacter sp. NBH84]